MPIVQVRNASMEQLNSADLLDVEERNFGAEWYDHAGGQVILLGTGPFTLNLDTERINSAPEFYSMAADILTIAEAGLYLFSFQLMLSSNGDGINRMWLEQDPDTGTFVAVPSVITHIPTPAITVTGNSTGMVTSLIQVGINYRYRIRYEQITGSTPCTTVVDGSKLSVVRLFKNG